MQMISNIKIVIVGCGGTGSNVITNLIKDFRSHDFSKVDSVLFIDGDIVEEKNLKNQCFIREDIGMKKSTVFAEIAEDETDKHIFSSIPNYIVNSSDVLSVLGKLYDNDLVILVGCSDNNNCRLLLENIFNELSTVSYYDSGNDFSSGQIVFANKYKKRKLSPVKSELYPDIFTSDLRSVTELSCEELNASQPQHRDTNRMAGLLLSQAINKLLDNGTLTYGLTTFNLETGINNHINYVCDEKGGIYVSNH